MVHLRLVEMNRSRKFHMQAGQGMSHFQGKVMVLQRAMVSLRTKGIIPNRSAAMS
jgi:hypothetical protein